MRPPTPDEPSRLRVTAGTRAIAEPPALRPGHRIERLARSPQLSLVEHAIELGKTKVWWLQRTRTRPYSTARWWYWHVEEAQP
jgi:hypothetical protein